MKLSAVISAAILLSLVDTPLTARAAEQSASSAAPDASLSRVIEVAGTVDFRPGNTDSWSAATNGLALRPGDRLRTGIESRAAVQLSDRSIMRLSERTTLELQPPRHAEKRRFGLLRGVLFFFNRERPSDVEFETPVATGAIRGTEFVLEADAASGATRLALLDGRVELAAANTTLVLESGEQARIEPGRAPVKSPLLEAGSIIQWALYYPAVVDPGDLNLTPDDRTVLANSLVAYRAGDLLAAHSAVTNVVPGGAAREHYRAALDLAVGSVELAEARLALTSGDAPVARALRELIHVVRGGTTNIAWSTPQSASEWLARSYTLQARFQLRDALRAAEQSAALAPNLGFAQARVAELNLAFERREAALAALERALTLSPRLAQAHALRGFVWLEKDSAHAALASFDQAIAIDAALGSAWLGRGLAQLRLRLRDEALRSLQTAAALDPRRALHRGYLAKGFSQRGEAALAEKEFRLAKELDPNDPTAWLYSALHAWQQNRPNLALRDLERSVELNDNRQLFRSRLLLDRDLAVRNANLAALYRDAGLPEASLRAASRAVSEDYANFSAHLFLANSYQALEDPNRFDLRFETARQSELLVANLLAPPGAANLSQLVSQQEHLQFFDPRPFGASSLTEYRSTGDWRQEASFFGSLGDFSYALDAALEWQRGQEINDRRERRDVSLQLKQRLTSKDEVYFQAAVLDAETGDVARHYDPAAAKRDLRVAEEQIPNLYLGWHRAWSPAHHTLLLFARLIDDLELRDNEPSVLFFRQTGGATTSLLTPPFFELNFASRFTLYTAELQHLWQSDRHALVVGARGQAGTVEPNAALSRPLTGVVTDQNFEDSLRRINAYAYYHWRVAEPLQLVVGLSYDRLTHPLNTELPPLIEGGETRDLLAPKAGVLFTPWRGGLARAGYSRSLGGVFFDNSVRLEPTQIAGFNQAFRSLLPESVAGLVPGTEFDTINASFDQSLRSGTYFGIEAELLRSDGDRIVGVLTNSLPLPIPDSPSSTRQALKFRERSLSAYAVQLIGDGLSAGLRYRVSDARLDGRFPEVPASAAGLARLEQAETSLLHQVALSLNFQHASGVFAQWESAWFHQDNHGYQPARAGDDFWQHNAFIGYRWPRRRAELRAGVLNLADTDYRLNPLNLYTVLPRARTAVVSLRLNF